MCNNNVEQAVLVVSADCLNPRRSFVHVESADEHLSDVGEVDRVLKESNGYRLLDG